MPFNRLLLLAGFSYILTSCPVQAKVFSSLDQAIEKAFPDGQIKREVLYPTKKEHQSAMKLAGKKIPDAPVYRYLAYRDGTLIGIAYPDRHQVRTLPELLLVLVTPEGGLKEIQVLAFMEPLDYLPRTSWYDQFKNKPFTRELDLNRDIDGVTGATLTARATTDAARRVLALHQILSQRKKP